MSDTIAAIATGSVLSAISIIRISGDSAIQIADRVFRPKNGKNMISAPDRKLIYGDFIDTEGRIIDICLCTVSRAPNSYTGENTAEFHCHGSPVVAEEVLSSLFAQGARQAKTGEFTKRAFLNGKMDLIQAEAVIDLIDAETADAARNAAGQLGRAVSRKTDEIYGNIVDIMSHYHAVIDYPDEDIPDFESQEYIGAFENAEKTLSALLATFERGKIMKDGVRAAIIGRPNTGKSSLLNALLGYDRAIVTDIAGTTRDTIEERVKLKNTVLRLADTAGIRETGDIVEKIGVERALAASKDAQLVIAVIENSMPLTEEDISVLKTAAEAPYSVAVINKCDLPPVIDKADVKKIIATVAEISASDGTGIDGLCDIIDNMFAGNEKVPCGEIITNARQAEVVSRALDSVIAAKNAILLGVTPDAVLTEAETAVAALGELTGRTVKEDVTARIFERFCVGK